MKICDHCIIRFMSDCELSCTCAYFLYNYNDIVLKNRIIRVDTNTVKSVVHIHTHTHTLSSIIINTQWGCALNGRSCPCVLKIGVEFVVEDVSRRVRAVGATRAQEVHEGNIQNNQEKNEKYYEQEESNTLKDSVGTAGEIGNPGRREGEREKIVTIIILLYTMLIHEILIEARAFKQYDAPIMYVCVCPHCD